MFEVAVSKKAMHLLDCSLSVQSPKNRSPKLCFGERETDGTHKEMIWKAQVMATRAMTSFFGLKTTTSCSSSFTLHVMSVAAST